MSYRFNKMCIRDRDKLPLIRQSVIVALIASVITAAIFQMLFTNSGASRELLERCV